MKLSREVTELLEAGVIDQATAEKISNYYAGKTGSPQNKLVIVFGILGALLVSLGIVLILAHNWDDLNRATKTAIAFLPMLIGQGLCGYTLLRRSASIAWREASSVFLVFAVGICIGLISQIYNLPGNMSSFMVTWSLLALPVVYVMNSSSASLLYIIGITYYACTTGYWESFHQENYLYWGLLLLVFPHYYYLFTKKSESNFFTFHNWFIPLSIVIVLGTLSKDAGRLMFVAYMSLFGLLYLIGGMPVLREQKIRDNGYLLLGSLGTVVLLLMLGFDWFWFDLRSSEFSTAFATSPEFIATVIITVAAVALLIYQKAKQTPITMRPAEWVFIVFIGIFFWGMSSPYVVIWINLLTLAIAVLTIREGAVRNHLGILNYGLLIITALIICRFFDINIGFVLKGLLFVLVGFGFFFANLWMIRKKKKTVKPA
jgi:uncharacterized membrane protein